MRFFDSTLKNSHFRFKHKDNANGVGGSSGSLVLLLFTRFSRDWMEISLFGSSKVYQWRPDVLGRSARGPARMFSDVVSWQRVKSWSAFFFFFFFFSFPSCISGVHHFRVRFLRMWPFFNPTIKVVTFGLRGWCVLVVFLLPAFTHLGHERQDLLSPCDEMRVCTD